MLDFSKVAEKLRKNFPDITQEEIDEMISQIPAYLPMQAVDAMIKMTKACMKNPAKRKLLKKISASELLKDSSISVDESITQ